MPLQLQFESEQPHQLAAVGAVVELFSGQPVRDPAALNLNHADMAQTRTELGLANSLLLDDETLLANTRHIQQQHDIVPQSETLQGRHFSLEMETGTGKTYVYLRTIFELHRRYGFARFVILVPGVAIREGVLKSVAVTREHFRSLYDGLTLDCALYDARKPARLRNFAQGSRPQVLVINIDALNKRELNLIHQPHDSLAGRRPIEFIAQARPILILDEPQNMESPRARSAIAQLNPTCTLRYSATHRYAYNLLYRLDPVEAYDRRLVKRIEVLSVLEGNPETAVAVGAADCQQTAHARMQAQLDETIRAHLEQELLLARCLPSPQRVKVLSLVFIDRVSHYANDPDDPRAGNLRSWFEASYLRQAAEPLYAGLNLPPVSQVHAGYFARDRSGWKDTSGRSRADRETYRLIMRDKERLLSPDEPLRFIFSHSALREGWDNPNVFQICTLAASQSQLRKRQEIGRGLRLPVLENGQRLRNPVLNRLTVIANEHYHEFAQALQSEIEQETGVSFAGRVSSARARVEIELVPGWRAHPAFAFLWERLRQPMQFRIRFESETLIERLVAALAALPAAGEPRFEAVRGSLQWQRSGDVASRQADRKSSVRSAAEQMGEAAWLAPVDRGREVGEDVDVVAVASALLGRLAHSTQLTRSTLLEVLRRSGCLAAGSRDRLGDAERILSAIEQTLRTFVAERIEYVPSDAEPPALEIFERHALIGDRARMLEFQHGLWAQLPWQSAAERDWLAGLDKRDDLDLLLPLPPALTVATPWGAVHPGWAIVLRSRRAQRGVLQPRAASLDLPQRQCLAAYCRAVGLEFAPADVIALSE